MANVWCRIHDSYNNVVTFEFHENIFASGQWIIVHSFFFCCCAFPIDALKARNNKSVKTRHGHRITRPDRDDVVCRGDFRENRRIAGTKFKKGQPRNATVGSGWVWLDRCPFLVSDQLILHWTLFWWAYTICFLHVSLDCS